MSALYRKHMECTVEARSNWEADTEVKLQVNGRGRCVAGRPPHLPHAGAPELS